MDALCAPSPSPPPTFTGVKKWILLGFFQDQSCSVARWIKYLYATGKVLYEQQNVIKS